MHILKKKSLFTLKVEKLWRVILHSEDQYICEEK